MDSRNHNIQIYPTNTLANGKVSFKNGNPVLRFEIGERDQYLLAHTIRLVGKFSVYKDAARTVMTDANASCRMPENLGVYSCIDSLTFGTMRTKQTLEYIKSYSRFVASYLDCVVSKEDAMTYLNNQALIMPNYRTQQAAVVMSPYNADTGTKNSFSIPLISGIANGGNPIPLSSSWGTGGLEITINLMPDTNVLFSGLLNSDSSAFTNGFYELSDVSLVAECTQPAAQELQALSSQPASTFEFNTISSFYQTINSTNATLNLNLGQSHVLSVFGTFVPVNYINTLSENGQATLYPLNKVSDNSASSVPKAVIEQLVWTRAGSRFPYHYNQDIQQRDDATNETPDPQIIRNYINAVGSFAKGTKTQISTANNYVVDNIDCNPQPSVNGRPSASGVLYKHIPLGGMTAGIGINYDSVSGNGVDFSQVPFGLQMQVGLTTDHPNALYLYVHCRNTMIASGGSIQIVT